MARNHTPADSPPNARPRADAAALAVALVFPTLVTLAYFVWLKAAAAGWQQLAWLAGKTLQFGFPAVWVLVVRHERLSLRRPTRADWLIGCGTGGAAFVVAVALYALWLKPIGLFAAAEPALRARLTGVGLDSGLGYAVLAVFYSAVHSLLEEYYWRWFVFARLNRFVSTRRAALISSAGFAAHHVFILADYFGWQSGATWGFSLAVALGGFGWAWLYHRTRTLATVWISHALVDAAIFTIGFDLVKLSARP